MARISEVVLVSAALVACAAAAADIVQPCPGKSNLDTLRETVRLSPCKRSPCKLRKGTDQYISVKFTPDQEISSVKNHVTAEVFGVPLPFVGVDGASICEKIYNADGEATGCPLRAGTEYTYKDSFPVLSFYPSIEVKVHWALMQGKKELVCFEIPVEIK